MVSYISSKENKTAKLIRQLKKKSIREKTGQFVAEGRKIVLEALKYVPQNVICIVVSDEFCEKEADILVQLSNFCGNVYRVPQNLFAELSDTDTPQGVLAVLAIPENSFVPDSGTDSIIILDKISEPGNMGTVIRTAEALGYDAIYLMQGCTDIYSPKTVRSTMGSLFRMNFKANCTAEDILSLKELGFSVVATTPAGNTVLETFEASPKTAVVIGNEAHGVSDEILQMADYRVKISMDGMAESLNAAVAAGIVMHWLKSC